jgi:alpha-galactosidase
MNRNGNVYGRLTMLFSVCAVLASSAEVRLDPSGKAWTLRTGMVEYKLRQEGEAVRLEYFGPSGMGPWRMSSQRRAAPLPGYDISGVVSGQLAGPEDLVLVSADKASDKAGVETLSMTFRHRRLPLEIQALYAAWGDTGVISRRLKLTNRGTRILHVESLPDLSWRLPPGDYDLTYLWGGWGQEKQLATERLAAGRRSLVSSRGRSTSVYSPWFSLANKTLGVRYVGELAYSGNWAFQCERLPGSGKTLLEETDLLVSLGAQFDFEGPLALPPGGTRSLPEVAFTASTGDLDDVTNQMHHYQRRYVFPRTPTNDPLLVQFNSWYPFPGKMTVQEMKDCADIAVKLGAEVFVLDAGWYNKKNWSSELGDYEADRVAYPNGIEELAKHVHGKGMKFGIWVEIENVGTESEMFKKHPDWLLSYNGEPIVKGVRMMLNFAKPEVRAWAHGVVDRLLADYGLEWMKIDYNIDIGSHFDPPAGAGRSGAVLMDHVASYYRWLDEVRAKHPALVIENCSSGGLRFDLGIMGHTHTTWLSDVVEPIPSVQLAYGCTVEFAPEVCNHWMVGDTTRGEINLANPPGWWDFMLRVPMNGQYGISSRVFDWTPALRKRVAENVALYKRIRRVIADADVYHLTPAPANQNPSGWMGLQYVLPDGQRSVVMAYRLARSEGEYVFRLRGLKQGAIYRISVDGEHRSKMRSREIAERGLPVRLDAEWRAAVIELEAED